MALKNKAAPIVSRRRGPNKSTKPTRPAPIAMQKNILKDHGGFKKKRPSPDSGWVAIYTLVLAAVAGLQTCVLSNQLQEMREENRPWIYAETVDPWSQLLITDTNAEIVLRFNLMNTGRFPSRFTNIAKSCHYVRTRYVDFTALEGWPSGLRHRS